MSSRASTVPDSSAAHSVPPEAIPLDKHLLASLNTTCGSSASPTVSAQAGGQIDTNDVVVTLRPGTVVVDRGDGTVQVGLASDCAVYVVPPRGCPPGDVVRLLLALDGSDCLTAAAHRADFGIARLHQVREVLSRLVEFGHLHVTVQGHTPGAESDSAVPPIRWVHLIGSGPIAHILRGPLKVNGCRVGTTSVTGIGLDPARPPWRREGRDPDVVVLTDSIVADPLLTTGLVAAGITHLHMHCREGRVVVGPMVIPGRTPCLRCLDLYRADRDPQWPQVAAQLLGQRSSAPVPALTAATALVLSDIAATRAASNTPQTVGATIEISPAEGLWRRRPWPAHRRCGCGAAAKPEPLT